MIDRLKRWRSGPVARRLRNLRHIGGAALAFRPGHFYSPVPDPQQVRLHWRDPAGGGSTASLPGIATDLAAEHALWARWATHRADPGPALDPSRRRRYRLEGNRNYGVGDAIVYEAMLRETLPRRLVEIGSGFSTALALDVLDAAGLDWPDITVIEPYPALLHGLLLPGDMQRMSIIPCDVQAAPDAPFVALRAGDILFIDSTHVAKTGSDVLHEVFNLLPLLAPGVIVHFHDVFWPFEYPRAWVVDGNYGWNEIYLLRAFLTGNADWRITFFNDHFAKLGGAVVQETLALTGGDLGGGLWLRKA